MPDRDQGGRTLAAPSRAIPTRTPVGPRDSGRPFNPNEPDVETPFVPNRPSSGPPIVVPVGPATAVPTGTNNVPPPASDRDPYDRAADLFAQFFGAGPVSATPDSPVVVGDAGFSQGSSGSGMMIIILLIVAGVGYYLYKRYKGGQSQ